MLRRSLFIAVMYAFSFVLANFGIAMAARMPMMTTTIRSSISVKPFRFRTMCSPDLEGSSGSCVQPARYLAMGRPDGSALPSHLAQATYAISGRFDRSVRYCALHYYLQSARVTDRITS